MNVALLTISDSRTLEDDPSGDHLKRQLLDAGHHVMERAISPDDRYDIRAVVSRWIADPRVDAVITNGGTGLTGRDGTPEAVTPLLDKTIDGFGELFRVLSFQTIGTSALQSRCLAGVANGTFVFVLLLLGDLPRPQVAQAGQQSPAGTFLKAPSLVRYRG